MIKKDETSDEKKPEAIKLAEWAEWFLRNVRGPLDFRWTQMGAMAKELRRLQEELEEIRAQISETGSNESAYQRGYLDGIAKGRREVEVEIINDGYVITVRTKNPHKFGAAASLGGTTQADATLEAVRKLLFQLQEVQDEKPSSN